MNIIHSVYGEIQIHKFGDAQPKGAY